MESLAHDLWVAQFELKSDPKDLAAWHRLASGLSALGDAKAGARALGELGRAAAEAGFLPLALLACKDLQVLDEPEADKLLSEIVRLYGAGSARIDPLARPHPPGSPTVEPPPPAPSEEEILAAARKTAIGTAASARRRRGRDRLPFAPLFSLLPPEPFTELVKLLVPRRFRAGEVVIEQSTLGTAMFIIARGTCRVLLDDQLVAVLRAGAVLGEMALLASQPRSARVVCETDAVLFGLERESLEELSSRHPEVALALADHCQRRLLENLLARSPLFVALPIEERLAVMARFSIRASEPGIVVSEGMPVDGLYVIVRGAATVEKKDGPEPLRLAELGPGDAFGEISLVRGRPATASVTARTRLQTLFLGREDFELLAKVHPALVGAAFALATEREKQNASALGTPEAMAEQYLL